MAQNPQCQQGFFRRYSLLIIILGVTMTIVTIGVYQLHNISFYAESKVIEILDKTHDCSLVQDDMDFYNHDLFAHHIYDLAKSKFQELGCK